MDAATLEEIIVQYRTLDEAARQGLIKALAQTTGDIEWGGIIFQDPRTGMYYMAGGGPHEGIRDNIQIRGTRRTKGDLLAGAYHAHPDKDKRGIFSKQDTSAAKHVNVPFYLGLAHDQTARIFDPRTTTLRRSNRGSISTGATSPGELFMGGRRMEREIHPDRANLLVQQ